MRPVAEFWKKKNDESQIKTTSPSKLQQTLAELNNDLRLTRTSFASSDDDDDDILFTDEVPESPCRNIIPNDNQHGKDTLIPITTTTTAATTTEVSNHTTHQPQDEERDDDPFSMILDESMDQSQEDDPFFSAASTSLVVDASSLLKRLHVMRKELKVERELRKKKQKSLYKLAKELHSRTSLLQVKEQQITHMTVAFGQMEQIIERAKEKAASLEQEADSLREDHSKRQKEYEVMIAKFTARLEEAKEKHYEASAKLQNELEENAKVATKLQNKIEKMEEKEEKMVEEAEQREQDLQSVRAELKVLRKRVKDVEAMEQESNIQSVELSEAQTLISEVTKQLKETRKSAEKESERYRELQLEHSAVNAEKDRLDKEYKHAKLQHKAEIQRLTLEHNLQVTKLQEDLFAATEEVERLRRCISNIGMVKASTVATTEKEQQLQETEAVIQVLQDEITSLTCQRKSAMEETVVKRRELVDASHKIADLQRQLVVMEETLRKNVKSASSGRLSRMTMVTTFAAGTAFGAVVCPKFTTVSSLPTIMEDTSTLSTTMHHHGIDPSSFKLPWSDDVVQAPTAVVEHSNEPNTLLTDTDTSSRVVVSWEDVYANAL